MFGTVYKACILTVDVESNERRSVRAIHLVMHLSVLLQELGRHRNRLRLVDRLVRKQLRHVLITASVDERQRAVSKRPVELDQRRKPSRTVLLHRVPTSQEVLRPLQRVDRELAHLLEHLVVLSDEDGFLLQREPGVVENGQEVEL